MENNEAGKTRVDDAQASKLSVSIFAYFKIRRNQYLDNNCVFAFDCIIYDLLSNYKVH